MPKTNQLMAPTAPKKATRYATGLIEVRKTPGEETRDDQRERGSIRHTVLQPVVR